MPEWTMDLLQAKVAELEAERQYLTNSFVALAIQTGATKILRQYADHLPQFAELRLEPDDAGNVAISIIQPEQYRHVNPLSGNVDYVGPKPR